MLLFKNIGPLIARIIIDKMTLLKLSYRFNATPIQLQQTVFKDLKAVSNNVCMETHTHTKQIAKAILRK